MQKLSEQYEPVNTVWPSDVPPITRHEATRAAKKLVRHFCPDKPSIRIRRCWIAMKECNRLNRGWRRLVHDVSHSIMSKRGHFKPHSGIHAKLEMEVAQYVMEKGWLNGCLKSAPKPFSKPTPNSKLDSLAALMKKWETKKKRADNAIKKLNRRISYYRKKVSGGA